MFAMSGLRSLLGPCAGNNTNTNATATLFHSTFPPLPPSRTRYFLCLRGPTSPARSPSLGNDWPRCRHLLGAFVLWFHRPEKRCTRLPFLVNVGFQCLHLFHACILLLLSLHCFCFWVLKFVVRAYSAMYPMQSSVESSKVCNHLVWAENSVGIISPKDVIAIYMATGDPHPLSACDICIELERPLLAIRLHASQRPLHILCYGRLLRSGKRQENFGNC